MEHLAEPYAGRARPIVHVHVGEAREQVRDVPGGERGGNPAPVGRAPNHRLSARERTKRIVAGKGAAFIIAGNRLPIEASLMLARIRSEPQRTASSLVSKHDG